MRLKTLLTLLLLFFLNTIHAQKKISKNQFLIDSARIVKPKLIRPQVRFDNRLIFFDKQKIDITGVDGGVLLKNKLRITLGYYSVGDKLLTLKKRVNNIDYQAQYDLKYGALNVEFIYKNKRYFSLGMPLEFGVGGNSLRFTSIINNLPLESKSGLIAMSFFGLSGTFKPIRWIGLKAAVGYRKVLFNNISDLRFDGVYTSIGVALDFREIITDYGLFRLKRKYYKKSNKIETAVDIITE